MSAMPTAPRKRPTLKRTSVFLTVPQLERLATLNERTGVPVAVMIRRSVDAYLDAHDPQARTRATR
jgi:predicted DNA-binding protein